MMRPVDLAAEMFAAAGRIEQRHLNMVRHLGVPPTALAHLNSSYPAIGLVDAERHGEGLWQPGAGPSHLVQPVFDDDILIDMVAWRSLRPDDWALRTGVAWALGEHLLRDRGWPDDAALVIHPTPLAWLIAGGAGLCIVDWKSLEIRRLADVDVIEVEDARFGALLMREITRPAHTPTLRVRSTRHVA